MRILAAVACLVACSAALAESRTWKTTSGKELEAEYVRSSIGIVTLKTAEGKQIRMPLSRLSPEDRAYVRKKLKEAPAPAKKSSARRRMRSSRGSPQVVARMKPGETSDVFATRFGFHIVRVLERKAAAPYALEEVADHIRERLAGQVREETIEKYLDGLREKATIEEV